MRIFTLLFEDDGDEARRIEFAGFEASEALTVLKHEKAARRAILLEEDRRLGTIMRSEDGFWRISA
jgi:hypothetical protein